MARFSAFPKSAARHFPGIIRRWYGAFFWTESALCVLAVLGIDRLRFAEASLRVPLLCGMAVCAIAALFILFLKSKRAMLQFENRQNAGKDGGEVEGEMFGKLRAAFFLASAILLTVFLRGAFQILQPAGFAEKICGKTETISGTVVSFSADGSDAAPFANPYLGGEETVIEDQKRKYQSLLLKTKYGLIKIGCPADLLCVGDIVNIRLKLSLPSAQRNPGGFDERAYLASCGIYLKGSCASDSPPAVTGRSGDWLYRSADAARKKILRIFHQNIPPEEAGLMAGLLIGDRSGMSQAALESFQKAGLSHITAVSGSAIAFLLIPVRFCLARLRVGKKKRDILTSGLLVFFGFVTGWTPSVSRALLMTFLSIGARALHYKMKMPQTLSVAVTCLLAGSPVYALNAGFWFSVLAAAGIVAVSGAFEDLLTQKRLLPGAIRPALAASLSAGICVMPLSIGLSGEVSAASVFSNLPVLPLVEIATILGSFVAVAGMIYENYFLTRALSVPLTGLLSAIRGISDFLSKAGFLHAKLDGTPVFIALAAAGAVVFLFLREKRRKQVCILVSACMLIIGLLHGAVLSAAKPDARIVFADVGQGDATLILLKTGESVLIDSGGREKGAPAIQKMLDFYSVQAPSVYIATHTHEDHCGGMIALLEERGGKSLILPAGTLERADRQNPDENRKAASGEADVATNLVQTAEKQNIRIEEAGAGDRIALNENFIIKFLNPVKSDGIKEGNASSMILQIMCSGHTILIAGDAPGEAEQKLAASGADIDSEFYRISHHGSPYSTNHDIINAVNPDVSIISVGANFYGHPSPDVVERLKSSGSAVFRTDQNGAVLIDIRGAAATVRTMMP